MDEDFGEVAVAHSCGAHDGLLGGEIELLAAGTLAQAFEKSVKAPRFVDRR